LRIAQQPADQLDVDRPLDVVEVTESPQCLDQAERLIERFGPLSFRIALRAEAGRLHYPVVGGRCLGVPLPRWALPVSQTVEAVDASGRASFDVALSHPLTGPIIRYRGWLEPEVTL
ncbi:MAG: DUF4166 domain-containing protein, partial [Tabrizicola sp.]|nr:DUF4166 domain-containing protein [Tabrizicola sp.]